MCHTEYSSGQLRGIINRISIHIATQCSREYDVLGLHSSQVDLSRTETTNEMLEVFAARLFSLRTISLASCHQVSSTTNTAVEYTSKMLHRLVQYAAYVLFRDIRSVC